MNNIAHDLKTILLVEDDQLVCDVISCVLEKQGYHVVSTRSPTEALEICKNIQTPPDLILTDIVMPGMKGTELAAILKKTTPTMKIIYMSGYTEHVITPKLLNEEKSYFISKPFTPKELLNKLQSVLDPECSS